MLTKKLATTIAATLLVASAGSAQGKTPDAAAPAAPASPAAKADEVVKTREGRTVVLKADGTWAYGADAALTSTSSGTLALEAGIVYMMGGAQPVARQHFRLLRKSLKDITTETLNDPEVKAAIAAEKGAASKQVADDSEVTDKHAALRYALIQVMASIGSTGAGDKAILAAIQRETAAELTTGFDGKGAFEPVPVGSYFVFGTTELRGNKKGLWCLPVQVKPGASSITLDQSNFILSY